MDSRLIKTFIELVSVDSESRNEGKFHELLKSKFSELGLQGYEDSTMKETKLGGNNLLFTLEGTMKGTPIFFSSHTDTVAPGIGIKPVIKDGNIYSDGTTILAADDKAGIAIMLELVTRLKEKNIPHGTIEFLLTPGEEIGLIGASAFDIKKLQSDFGFVLDNGGPVGSIILKSPFLATIDVAIKGKTAHAGLEPEKGVSAIEIAAKAISQMDLGRISETTTANIGTIEGGVASNIVADSVRIKAEARSLSKADFDRQIEHMKTVFEKTAESLKGSVTFSSDVKSVGYSFSESDPIVIEAGKAIAAIGIQPRYEVSGGGSDANVFNAKNKMAVNLSIGYEDVHTVEEKISVEEMEKAVLLCLKLVENAWSK